MLHPDKPALVLAPMEGVTDAPMRAVQGAAGAFTYAVSEFLRVSQHVPPRSLFLHHVPELRTACRTPTGLPVQVQLLGGDAGRLGEAARVACTAGATAIDLNFGCPAKTVNRHDGGATLLKYPKRIREIVAAVRAAVPAEVPVSAKLRLGWDCIDAIFENAAMAAEGGATWLTIHARTRTAMYAPPVYWPHIGRVREQLRIPVIANGDIWSIDDFRRCRDETGCRHFMLGRGALADPHLPLRVAVELGLMPASRLADEPVEWPRHLMRLVEWSRASGRDRPDRVVSRVKQWLKLAHAHGEFAAFERVKRATTIDEVFAELAAPGPTLAPV